MFRGEGEDVEDGASDGELSWFIDIVAASESEFEEFFGQFRQVKGVAFFDGEALFRQCLLGCYFFRDGGGEGDNHQGAFGGLLGGESIEHLGAKDVVGGIPARIFCGAAIGRGKEKHVLVAAELSQVVVEIACLLFIVENEEPGTRLLFLLLRQCGEDHGCGGTLQSAQLEPARRLPTEEMPQRTHAGMRCEKRKKFGDLHGKRRRRRVSKATLLRFKVSLSQCGCSGNSKPRIFIEYSFSKNCAFFSKISARTEGVGSRADVKTGTRERNRSLENLRTGICGL